MSLTHSEESQWEREVDEHEFAESVDWRSGPLARAVLIRQPGQVHDLVLSVPHCIADGTTALALLRQWVRLAAEPQTSAPDVADGPVPVAVEDLFPARYRDMSGVLPDKDPEAADDEPDTVQDAWVGRVVPDRFVPFHLRRTRLLHRSIDRDALEKLTMACRREGVTLHGVLAAAMASAVARDAGAKPRAHLRSAPRSSFGTNLTGRSPRTRPGASSRRCTRWSPTSPTTCGRWPGSSTRTSARAGAAASSIRCSAS